MEKRIRRASEVTFVPSQVVPGALWMREVMPTSQDLEMLRLLRRLPPSERRELLDLVRLAVNGDGVGFWRGMAQRWSELAKQQTRELARMRGKKARELAIRKRGAA